MQNNKPQVSIDPNPTKKTSLNVFTNDGKEITVYGNSLRECMLEANKIKNGII